MHFVQKQSGAFELYPELANRVPDCIPFVDVSYLLIFRFFRANDLQRVYRYVLT